MAVLAGRGGRQRCGHRAAGNSPTPDGAESPNWGRRQRRLAIPHGRKVIAKQGECLYHAYATNSGQVRYKTVNFPLNSKILVECATDNTLLDEKCLNEGAVRKLLRE